MGTSSYPDYADLRDSGVLGGLAAFAGISLTLDTDGLTERIDGQVVSGNYFDVPGVRPAAGRTFSPEEDRIGSPVRVAVLSHRLWQRRFGGDPGIVGRSITLNGNAYTVIGIAPRGFAGSVLGDAPEVWVPMALQEEVRPPSAGALRRSLGSARMLGVRDVRWLSMVGRLKDGASVADTAAALDVIGRRLAAAYPQSNRDLSATALPLGEGPGLRTRARPVLWLLTAAVILVLADRVRERGGPAARARGDAASRGGGPDGDRRRTRPARPTVAHRGGHPRRPRRRGRPDRRPTGARRFCMASAFPKALT